MALLVVNAANPEQPEEQNKYYWSTTANAWGTKADATRFTVEESKNFSMADIPTGIATWQDEDKFPS